MSYYLHGSHFISIGWQWHRAMRVVIKQPLKADEQSHATSHPTGVASLTAVRPTVYSL